MAGWQMVARVSGDSRDSGFIAGFIAAGRERALIANRSYRMKTRIATRRRRIFAVLITAAVPSAALGFLAVLAGPAATGASDPCAASEVARTIGSVAKSMGDYLDSHPETNHTMTTMLQQQGGPQSLTSLKSYFEANPKVAADLTSISQPLNGLSTQCKLPITVPQPMGLMQPTQGAGGLPAPPAAGGTLPGPPRGNTVG
jgi:hemophore